MTSSLTVFWFLSLERKTMKEPQNGAGLEDEFPFQRGDFLVTHVIFPEGTPFCRVHLDT